MRSFSLRFSPWVISLLVTAPVVFYAWTPLASAQHAICAPSLSSPLASLGPNESAALTVVNPLDPNCFLQPLPLTLLFLDRQGRVVKQMPVQLAPGQGAVLSLDYSELVPTPTTPPQREFVRAVIDWAGPQPSNNQLAEELLQTMQQLQALFEDINRVTEAVRDAGRLVVFVR
jgi:hypothetical protein